MLKGTRITLRAIARDDLKRLWAFNNDVEVELAGGGDPPLPQSFERYQADFDQAIAKGGRDGSSFVIEADGLCIGQCALHNFDHPARTAELGIAIGDHAYWGKGYGREAIGLLLQHGFAHCNLRKIWLRVHADNMRAIRAYLACGFVEEGRQRAHVWGNGAYHDLVLMGVFAAEGMR
jgi:RimJ/RimL family protein N-acetyltransferase